MNKYVKGLLIGGAIGASAMAVRAYKQTSVQPETDAADGESVTDGPVTNGQSPEQNPVVASSNLRQQLIKGAAVGAAAGIAVGLFTDLKPAFGKSKAAAKNVAAKTQATKAKINQTNNAAKKARKAMRATGPVSFIYWGQFIAAMTPVLGSVAEIWNLRIPSKKSPATKTRFPRTAVISGPLGRVRVSTMHMAGSAGRKMSKVATRRTRKGSR